MTANVNQKFTGQERDPEMTRNWDFFNARYFLAAAGTFSEPDPANAGADLGNPQSWNGYAYVGGNPLSFTDPTGENWWTSFWGDVWNGFKGVFGVGAAAGASVAVGAEQQQQPDFKTVVWGTISGRVAGHSIQSHCPAHRYQGSTRCYKRDIGTDALSRVGALHRSYYNPKNDPFLNRLACASNFGSNHSIASWVGAQGTFLGDFLGGNTFSGLADIWLYAKDIKIREPTTLARSRRRWSRITIFAW